MTGPVVMKMNMEMMLILTLYVPQPTLHCRLSGSGGQWESLSVKSGLIINSILELCLFLARDSVSNGNRPHPQKEATTCSSKATGVTVPSLHAHCQA